MNEKNIYIVRCGEIALKGKNKPYFERMLSERIRKNLRRFDDVEIVRHEGLIFVYSDKSNEKSSIVREIRKVFGVASVSPAVECTSELEEIEKKAVEYIKGLCVTEEALTFKVDAKRADKNFPVKSPDIARLVGGKILSACEYISVDVHNPNIQLFVDVRKDKTYIFHEKIEGYAGLPIGSNGKGMVLLSGGIDSPVAAFLMAKRGMLIEAVHFHSYPYTSERAKEKVIDLAKIISQYTGDIKIHMINILPIQELIVEHCPPQETTIIVRRFMMRIAEKIADQVGALGLITGENLGQVASQTAHGLVATNDAVTLPVFRPLIALEKNDIIEKAREIGTFETSILPFEDSCTVFLPKHPTTRPQKERIRESEVKLNVDKMVDEAIEQKELIVVTPM